MSRPSVAARFTVVGEVPGCVGMYPSVGHEADRLSAPGAARLHGGCVALPFGLVSSTVATLGGGASVSVAHSATSGSTVSTVRPLAASYRSRPQFSLRHFHQRQSATLVVVA